MKLLQKTALGLIRLKFRVLGLFSKRAAARSAFNLFCTPRTRTRNGLPGIFARAVIRKEQFSGFTVVGYHWNIGGSRKVLIAHGYESSAANFAWYVDALVKKGYEVLAFDAPAHGYSTGKKFNALVYKEFIREMIGRFGPFQSLFGHSLGALAICMGMAETLHDDDTRIALVAPVTSTVSIIDDYFRLAGIIDEEVRQEFDRIIMHLSGHEVDWFSVPRTLPSLQGKILWFHDRDDDKTPFADAAKVWKQNRPGLQYVSTNGLGHRRIYRDAEVGRTIVDFL